VPREGRRQKLGDDDHEINRGQSETVRVREGRVPVPPGVDGVGDDRGFDINQIGNALTRDDCDELCC